MAAHAEDSISGGAEQARERSLNRCGGLREPVLEKSRESRLRTEIRDLKRLLVEKTLEADFFEGALQKIAAQRREGSGSGEPAFTTTSGT